MITYTRLCRCRVNHMAAGANRAYTFNGRTGKGIYLHRCYGCIGAAIFVTYNYPSGMRTGVGKGVAGGVVGRGAAIIKLPAISIRSGWSSTGCKNIIAAEAGVGSYSIGNRAFGNSDDSTGGIAAAGGVNFPYSYPGRAAVREKKKHAVYSLWGKHGGVAGLPGKSACTKAKEWQIS